MLAKVQRVVDILKSLVLYIAAPILTLLYLLPLLKPKRDPNEEKGEQVIAQDDCKGAVDIHEANAALESYHDLRERYLHEHSTEQKPKPSNL